MQQDFEKTFNEFLAKAKAHFESQNSTIAEYENFFNRAQELFPAYTGFVQHVNEALLNLNDAILANQEADEDSVAQPMQAKSIPAKKPQLKFETQETKNVLIVDDAEINRVLMSHLFKTLPIKLEFANSGDQALTKAAEQNFDLILMDLQMKGMSGIDTIKAIRSAQPEQKTLIIAITNLEPTDDERAQTMDAGANEYLSKSMTREALRERVAGFLFGASQISA